MSKWSPWKFTDAGKKVQAQAEAGKILTFTKMVLGDGYAESVDEYADRTALISPVKELPIASVTVGSDNFAKVTSTMTNQDLEDAFYVRELGLYAKDQLTGESVLFAAMIDTDPDAIPGKGTSAVITKTFNVFVGVKDEASVTAVIDPDGLVAQSELIPYMQFKVGSSVPASIDSDTLLVIPS